ncbi:MAG: hypothetical protein EP343_01325 [Deltaproteobacteria bacterium]|nr:MAG: hypothetical protein EP343_01325 [Deltaproteobacteria bacterium]
MPECNSYDILPASGYSQEILSVQDFSYEEILSVQDFSYEILPSQDAAPAANPDQRGQGRFVVLVNINDSQRARYFLAKKLHEMWGGKSFQDYRNEVESSLSNTIMVMKTDDETEAESVKEYFIENQCDAKVMGQTKLAGISVF